MADPIKHESSTDSVGDIFAALDDLDENVSDKYGIDYSQSLSDLFANNDHFLREEIDTLLFPQEYDENLTIAFGSSFEEISHEQLGGDRATPVINEQESSDRATTVINEHGSSETEIKQEPETKSETQVQEENVRAQETEGAAESESLPVRDLPERYRAHIDRVGGRDIRLIFEKKLSKTDVDARSARLKMQHSKLLPDFMAETKSIENGGEMDINLVDTHLKERSMTMGTWKSMAATYVLKKAWNDVVRENGLKFDDEVQIWSFRVDGELRLALVVPNKAVGDGGENDGESSEVDE